MPQEQACTSDCVHVAGTLVGPASQDQGELAVNDPDLGTRNADVLAREQ
jgi:hypothetical protein